MSRGAQIINAKLHAMILDIGLHMAVNHQQGWQEATRRARVKHFGDLPEASVRSAVDRYDNGAAIEDSLYARKREVEALLRRVNRADYR